MLKKIILTILLLGIGSIAYFGYPIIKERYFENEDQQRKSDTIIIDNNRIETDTDISADESDDEINITNDVKDDIYESGNEPNINADDCDNECVNFKANNNDFEYCQSICDLHPMKDSDNCDSRQGSDRDYCFLNQAILKTDLKICDQAQDIRIKKTCKNRVMEDIMENQ